MKKPNTLLLWISFFLTTSITFGAITIPSYLYWNRYQVTRNAIFIGIVGSLIFGLTYATYKLKTLHHTTVEMGFSALQVDPKRYISKELRRLGYREQEDHLYFAGFRADYYMAPDIKVTFSDNAITLSGPKFYLHKLLKRHRRLVRRSRKNRSDNR